MPYQSEPSKKRSNRRISITKLVYQPLEPRQVLSAFFPTYINGQYTLGQRDAAAPYALRDTFQLESNPSATKTIYLDFDGHHSVGNQWGHNIQFPAYNREGSQRSFSNAELIEIQKIFQNVAEDFLPFNVNVTTRDPGVAKLARTGSRDVEYGVRVVMTQAAAGFGDGVGGWAYIDRFGDRSDTPAFVFNKGDHGAAVTASHEVGHTLGLFHDGKRDSEYYGGHGTGETSWGPLMGGPYRQALSQWSDGNYSGATNRQDDLAIITSEHFGYRADDVSNTRSNARFIASNSNRFFTSGIISHRSDVDVYRFQVTGGNVSIQVKPFQEYGNLDVMAQLMNSNGRVIATRNPGSETDANFQLNLAAGEYYLRVDGTGKTGAYSDYGSLGFYTVEGNIQMNVTAIGETGAISRITDQWQTIQLENRYNDPVVVVGPPSDAGPDPVTVRVRNVTATSFEVQLHEWDYLDRYHQPESLSYMVIEAGTHTLPDGTRLTAQTGFVNTQARRIGFGFHFSRKPVVLAQVTSKFGGSAVTPRVNQVTTGGFDIRLQEEEANDNLHSMEQFSIVAIEQGTTQGDGMQIDARVTGRVVNEDGHNIQFRQNYTEQPILLAQIQSLRGSDPSSLRISSPSVQGAGIILEEEKSFDAEVAHAREVVGYLAIRPGLVLAQDTSALPRFSSYTLSDPVNLGPMSEIRDAFPAEPPGEFGSVQTVPNGFTEPTELSNITEQDLLMASIQQESWDDTFDLPGHQHTDDCGCELCSGRKPTENPNPKGKDNFMVEWGQELNSFLADNGTEKWNHRLLDQLFEWLWSEKF